MSITVRALVLASFTLAWGPTALAQLEDHGQNGEYFRDTTTGLYWYDPAQFVGQTRAAIDAFVQASPIWNWATSAQIDALNGKSSSTGQLLTTVMGPQQFTLTNGGPRWIGYHSSVTNPDGWLVQSSGAGFTTINATGFQNNVITWGPGAWLVSTTSPTSGNSLTMTQPSGSGSLLIQVQGPANANYFTAISFDPANATAPGAGWWQGLHISLIDLAVEVQFNAPPFIGTLSAAGSATFSLPPATLAPTLPDAHAVTTFFNATWTTQLGVTGIVTLDIM